MKSILLALFLCLAATSTAQNLNNTLRGKVLYQSSGNKPAVGVRIAEPDATAVFSVDNGDYLLKFQTKRNGAALALEVGKDDGKNQKLELVNEKELKGAKLPASMEEVLDIIVCPAGQRDIAAQKYYRILRTTADRELEKANKEFGLLLTQKEKDFQKITDLSERITKMQAALDSAKIREQAFIIASINTDRASQMVKDAVQKIDEENDVEGALKILSAEALDTAYQQARVLKQKAEAAIRQVIEGYEFKVSLLEPQYKYREAAECYEKMSEIYEKEDYDKEVLVVIFSNASSYWSKNGNYSKQLEFALKAISLQEKGLFHDSLGLATLYNNLATAYSHLDNHQKALEFNLKSLAIQEKVLPTDYSGLAIVYNNLGLTYGDLYKYKNALEFNLKAVAIFEKFLPTDHLNLATSYASLAWSYDNLGMYNKALEFNIKALNIREKALPSDHPDLAKLYINMAVTYSHLDEFQKQLDFCLKALIIREKVLPANHPDLISSYDDLASTYSYLGDYQKALELHMKAFSSREKTLPAENTKMALSYSNLSLTYSQLGDYKKQLEFNLKAIAIWQKILPADDINLAGSYLIMAGTYENIGDYQKQLAFNMKALTIIEKTLPIDHPNVASVYGIMAINYSNLCDYKKSLKFSLKSLYIHEKILPSNNSTLAISYSNTGRAYSNVGEHDKGIIYAQKSIIIGESLNPKPSYLNRIYANQGITYVKAHRYMEAKAALEKSEELKEDEKVYRGWALYYALQNDKPRALENLQKAVALGCKNLKWIETEPDLKNIRKEKGYKDIVEQLKKQ